MADRKSLGLIVSLMFAASMATFAVQPYLMPRVAPVVVTPPAPTPAPEIPPAPPVIQVEPALVIVTDASGKRIESTEIEAVASKLAVGTWIVHAIPKPGDTGWTRSVVVSEGAKPSPQPKPEPQPPPPDDPKPQPQPPAPQPIAGMRVLVLYETDQPLPVARIDAMNSQQVLDYLREKCLKGADGKTPERRFYDDDSSMVNMPQAWQDLRAKLPAQCPLAPEGYPIPQVAIGDSSGGVVFSGPYPPTDAEALALFQRFGGP